MKQLFVFTLTLFFITSTVFSQISLPKPATVKRDTVKKIIVQNKTTPTAATPPPPPPPPPSSTNKEASIYKLTSARVSILTGNDNKEFPSEVSVYLRATGLPDAMLQPGANLKNEMKSNSWNEFGLQHSDRATSDCWLLSSFQSRGLLLRIWYNPNFMTDAWRIEGVKLTLEFKDQFGNLHPTYCNKTIVFNNTSGFLDNGYRTMECKADASFVPLTSSIKQ